MKTSIARLWHGTTRVAQSDQYLEYVLETGARDIQATPGNLDLLLLRSNEGDIAHFWMLSTWESTESIKAFAGEEPEKPRYYPRDVELLLRLEDRVIHCETVWADLVLANAASMRTA